MSEFMSFNSMEEAYEFMQRGDEFGNRNLHPKQQAITYGQHWVRFYDVADRLIIFGYIYTLDELRAIEERYIDRTGSPESIAECEEELRYTMESTAESHERGYMYGWAYSKVDNEPGSTHRFNMWPISKGLFEEAREAEWDVDRIHDDYRPELEQAFREYMRHAIAVARSGDKP